MTALILFGAGASFGSETQVNLRPPLGSALFDELENFGKVARSVPNDIKQQFRKNFEAGMAAYRTYANDNVMAFQRELAHYFARFSPSTNNVYARLISCVGTNNVIYSSLNYDLLFELAAAQIGFNTLYSANQQNGFVRFLKIHGSSNFWPNIPIGMFKGVSFSNNAVDVVAQVKPLNQHESIYRCVHDNSFSPAIAMYVEGKVIKVCPEYVTEQYIQWKRCVHSVKKIVVIGVRVNLDDVHIWSELGKASGELAYFGIKDDKPNFDKWNATRKNVNARFYESEFADSLEAIQQQLM